VHVRVHAFGCERGGKPGRVVVRRHVVQVAHGCLNVCVAHPRLDAPQVDSGARAHRPESVSRVVKHDRLVAVPNVPEPGGLEREGLTVSVFPQQDARVDPRFAACTTP